MADESAALEAVTKQNATDRLVDYIRRQQPQDHPTVVQFSAEEGSRHHKATANMPENQLNEFSSRVEFPRK